MKQERNPQAIVQVADPATSHWIRHKRTYTHINVEQNASNITVTESLYYPRFTGESDPLPDPPGSQKLTGR